MKPVIIIATAVICSVVAVFAIQFLIFSDNEIIIDNEIISSLTFDCAKQWDKTADHYSKMQENLGHTYEQSMKMLEESEEIGKAFVKNKCASTVNDWAYRTQDENTVWYSGIDWQMMAEMEEKWHKENP